MENNSEESLKEENERLRQMLDTFMSGYVSILSADLMTGECEFLKLGDRLSKLFNGGKNMPPWEVLQELYVNHAVCEEDREMVWTIMDRDYLKKNLTPGQSITREYRNEQGIPGDVKLIRANEEKVLYGFNEMDEEKAKSLNLDQKKSVRLKVECFGSFRVFADGEPLVFKRKKTKELLAYLIDRVGDTCTNEEIISSLWESENTEDRNAYLRALIHDLRTRLEEVGLDNVLVRDHRQLAVRRSLLDCDYYRMLDGDEEAINSFCGEYMSQYSWAEQTVGKLYFIKKSK